MILINMLETKTCFKNLLLNKYYIILEADLTLKKKGIIVWRYFDDVKMSYDYVYDYIDLLNCM